MERLDRIAYNRANERQNTVQPQAVNLAYAEPCPDQRSRHGSFYLPAVLARNARRWQEKAGYPQISQRTQIFGIQIGEVCVICGFPLPSGCRRRPGHGPGPLCRAMRCALLRAGSAGLSMRLFSKQHKAIEAEASVCTTLRKNGTAPASGYPRAAALPKVRTLFEGAQAFRKVRILENPGDSFEDAHPFPRCAPKTAQLRKETGSVTGSGRLARLVLHSEQSPTLTAY
jgi:hypothetical protein